jgi:crossover junction endodeoxyribonuclease RusA
LAYKDKVGWAARQVIKAPIEGPVGLGLLAYIAKGQPGDLDNIIKAIQDGLNGIAWIDDRQVVELQAKRIKAGPDRVVIRIWEVDQEAG